MARPGGEGGGANAETGAGKSKEDEERTGERKRLFRPEVYW